MNSLEALQFIIDMFNKYAQKPNDIGLFFKFCEAHDKVLKDLERLKQLEQEHANALQVIKILTDENKAQEMKKKVGWF